MFRVISEIRCRRYCASAHPGLSREELLGQTLAELGISKQTIRRLKRAGMKWLCDLISRTADDLFFYAGLCCKTIEKIASELAAKGLRLREPEQQGSA
jgi:DNA-directed RNA polymerase alpha subunit